MWMSPPKKVLYLHCLTLLQYQSHIPNPTPRTRLIFWSQSKKVRSVKVSNHRHLARLQKSTEPKATQADDKEKTTKDQYTMAPLHAGNDQSTDQGRLNKTTRLWSVDVKTAKTNVMARWLDETPYQEHWNAVSRINGPRAEERERKSKV
jgi:hypothetical protein